ncbi:MAG: phosphomannomutase [Gammaproteobacteria bacterium]|nr:phosphomannomutase [Gammaproteobacteria bacterium]
MTAFKAYDIRGRVPDQINAAACYAIGRAFAELIRPGTTVVGYDIRLTSPELAAAVSEGLLDGGSDVYDIGMCGTEEVYFATAHYRFGGGIMVTASHNPIDYNGLKLVREGSRPISGDSGLKDIEARISQGDLTPATASGPRGALHALNARPAYIDHLLTYIDIEALANSVSPKWERPAGSPTDGAADASARRPLKIIANPGNGGAGIVLDALAPHLPVELIQICAEPDGTFPNGIPNPLLTDNRAATAAAVLEHGADLGLAWDGDFDRCFFFDEQGRFIEGYYLVGLLAERLLAKEPGSKIIHDPRLTWNTLDQVDAAGGTAVQCKSGHAFIKERMRAEDALYGGEMSAHHYFRDFAYCDSGMIPWLLVIEHLAKAGEPLSKLVDERIAAFPCSGEINFEVENTQATIDAVLAAVAVHEPSIDRTDGVSVEFPEWRFNLRGSNTEPVIRLNIETRGDPVRLAQVTEQLSALIAAPTP